ncbi:MAG: hypothetical protein RR495_07415 [Anaerovoracaceae bacterium]
MLGKLFKYENKALARVLLPMYGAWLVVSALLGFSIKFVENSAFIAGITGFMYSAVVIASVVLTIILIIQRYYKNLLGNEGYLTLTLPVSTGKHLMSKSIIATVWGLIGIITGLLSMMIVFVSSTDPALVGQFFEQVFINLKHLATANNMLTLFELIILTIVAVFLTIIKVYAAISVGHIFDNHRILISVAAYLGFGVIELIIGNILNTFNFSENMFMIINGPGVQNGVNTVFSLGIIFFAVLASVYYTLSYFIIKNKLNLE